MFLDYDGVFTMVVLVNLRTADLV